MDKTIQTKYSPRSLAVRCLVIVVGVAIAGFGAGCVIAANLGADPVTAFVNAFGNLSGLGPGTAMNIFNLVFFVIILFINRKMINIGMILYTLLLGVFFGFFVGVMGGVLGDLQTATTSTAIIARTLMMLLGVVAVGIGLGMYQAADLGAGPSDAFNQTIAVKTKLQLRWERVIFDVIMVIGALVMNFVDAQGGEFRSDIFIGTILGVFAVGPIMAPVMFRGARIVNKWSGMDEDAGLGKKKSS